MIRVGKNFGNFKIERKIGGGGMGSVYEAMDMSLHRRVALKVIHSHLVGDPGLLRSFQQEAATQAQLTHPNIIALHAFTVIENEYVMVMEYVQGKSLRDELRGRGRFSIPDAVNCMKQLLRGLNYAHARHIVHSDIKPGNLILTGSGQLKILDFGIAALSGVRESQGRTRTMGTPWYASPEQICGLPLDHRTDLYSAGVTFYELISGELPFNADSYDPENPRAWVQEMKRVKPLSGSVPEVSGELEEFVKKTLRKQPEQRYQTSGQMLDTLDGIERSFGKS